jgi:serine/threonine protein kinase
LSTIIATHSRIPISSDTLVELGPLGKGAGGVVLKALHTPSMTVLALKCVDISDRGKRHQLVKELKELDSTVSDYIVRFYGAYFDRKSFLYHPLATGICLLISNNKRYDGDV